MWCCNHLIFVVYKGQKGGDLGGRASYQDETFLLVWKAEWGSDAAWEAVEPALRTNCLYCPPVQQKFGGFPFAKPVALYAELLRRFCPQPATVAEFTGKYILLALEQQAGLRSLPALGLMATYKPFAVGYIEIFQQQQQQNIPTTTKKIQTTTCLF